MSRRPPLLIAVMGPTASGKSALAESVATALDAVLLNADAFQVYRGLDIGTAKPRDRSAYRLLDLLAPTEVFSAGQWVAAAVAELESAWRKAQNVVVVGGTGLYIRALFEGYDAMLPPDPDVRREIADWERREGAGALAEHLRDADPALAATLDLQNPVRVRRALEKMRAKERPVPVRIPPYLQVKTALSPDPTALDAAIGQRVREMMDTGWEHEVRELMGSGIPVGAPGLRAIGYRRLWEAIEARNVGWDVVEAIARDTRRYARRQRTWLRSEPRLKTFDEPEPCVRLARVMDWIREYARR